MTYQKTLSLCAAVAITCTGLAVVAPPAFAKTRTVVVMAPAADAPTRRVSYADLNLASAQGETLLNRRVGYAVDDVCAEATGGDDGSLTIKLVMVRCDTSAWNGARPQIARAVQRAREIAATGSSTIIAGAITIAAPR